MQKRGLGSEVKRQNIRTLSLVVCTFTYLLVGAAIFDALESETERKRWEYLSHMKRLMVEKYNITQEDYRMIELVVTENKPNKSGPQWKFAGAFYFATVVLAMIGYGHSTPVTPGGRAFCIVYATIGIPLGLVMFQSIGERLNKFASVVIKKAKTLLRCKKVEATQMNLMFATGLLSSIIITSGAGVFSRYEGWTYFDSFYYCFVTLTTIGFGDYVALQNDHALTEKPGYVALSLVFILFGLAVVAASINLLVLRFMTMNTGDILREETETFPMNGQNVRSFEEEYLPQWSSAMYRDQFVDASSPCSSQTYTNQYICSTQHPNIYTSYPDLPVSRLYLKRTNYQLPSCACGKCSLQTKKLRSDEQINFKQFYDSKNDRIIV